MKDTNIHTSIYLLLDQDCNIHHCNSKDMDRCMNLIEEHHITKRIKNELPRVEVCRGSKITVDEVSFKDYVLYAVVIEKTNDDTEGIYNFKHLVYKDFCTGLYNRNMWEHLVEGKVNFNANYYSIALIDVDDLKRINDEAGHIEGDRALKDVANAIRASIRKEDIAIRYGGDEFLIVLPNTKEMMAIAIGDRIKQRLCSNCISADGEIDVSVGVAEGKERENMLTVMQQADKKMYSQKKAKKISNVGIFRQNKEEIIEK